MQDQQRGSQNLQTQIAKIESEDVHLWSIALLIGLAVAAGFAALIVPNVVWHHSILVHANSRYLPHLLFAFVALILIFNIYIFDQHRKLKWTREELLRQLVRGDVAERLSLLDPLTETYNRRYMEEALVKEASRAYRTGAALSLVMIDADGFKQVNTKFGHQQGDLILIEIAKLLKSTFRGSDTIVCYGGDEFLIMLPDTDEQQGQLAVERLAKAVDAWNSAGRVPGYRMGLSCGVAGYQPGVNIEQVVEMADQRMYSNKSAKASHGRWYWRAPALQLHGTSGNVRMAQKDLSASDVLAVMASRGVDPARRRRWQGHSVWVWTSSRKIRRAATLVTL